MAVKINRKDSLASSGSPIVAASFIKSICHFLGQLDVPLENQRKIIFCHVSHRNGLGSSARVWTTIDRAPQVLSVIIWAPRRTIDCLGTSAAITLRAV
jgi:hypothetical protein